MNKVVEIRPNRNIVARAIGESTVLVNLRTNRIYELNATASRIWELVGSGETRSEVVRLLRSDYDVSAQVAEREFKALLIDFEREGLLEASA